MYTYHLHIGGQVQGVGFRPFVMRLAMRLGLVGWVSNDNDGVHLEVNATPQAFQHFVDCVLAEKPAAAKITHHSAYQVDFQEFHDFRIVSSSNQAQPNLLITPDMATCAECQQELFDPQSRRYQYPFLSCTNCGVRYSVITQLPYDRVHTTMQPFEPCAACWEEYHDFAHRLCHSQTQSCATCGVQLQQHGQVIATESPEIIQQVVAAWQAGQIVAIKGVGGYLLTCDATQSTAVATLRQRKNRPTKPFALMFPDVDTLQQAVVASPEALSILQSPASPIVLLPLREEASLEIAQAEVAPSLTHLGVMLPYMPLFMLLCRIFGKPLVATSGNLSHSPIIADDATALQTLASVADLIVSHNRTIVAPQDDSVVGLDDTQKPILLRRSRGMAPNLLGLPWTPAPIRTLAMGAQMKSTFALAISPNSYVSQYLGSLESYDTQVRYKGSIAHFLRLFQTQPEQIIVDKHPDYFATQLGKTLAQTLDIPCVEVQHHTAHLVAVLAENNLLESPEPVLGVVFDGTGLGDDGHIWGGEFFIYADQSVQRVAHFPYFPTILGDKMAREPRIAALCALGQYEGVSEKILAKFTPVEWQVCQKRLAEASFHTSSIGRLFDAWASWLGLADKISYEGEAALLLQNIAYQFYKQNPAITHSFGESASIETLLGELVGDSLASKSAGFVALKFHFALVHWIKTQAEQAGVRQVAFSGGVFQNSLLVSLIKKYLSADFVLYFHQQLPPNDENIALGQLIVGQQKQIIHSTQQTYVFSHTR